MAHAPKTTTALSVGVRQGSIRALARESLRFIEAISPSCTCRDWSRERRHAHDCAIMVRLRLQLKAERLGLNWRT